MTRRFMPGGLGAGRRPGRTASALMIGSTQGFGAHLLEQRAEFGIRFEHGGFHGLAHGARRLAFGFGTLRGSQFFARGLDRRIILGRPAGRFQPLPLLGCERFELVAHLLGAVTGLFDFVERRQERRIGGQHRGAHGVVQLVFDALLRLAQ